MVRSALRIVLGVSLVMGAMFAIGAHAQNAAPGTAPPNPIQKNTCHLQGGAIVCEAPPSTTPEVAGAAGSPLLLAQTAKVGTLVNPYQAKEDAHDQALAEEGHKMFEGFGCPGCHGDGGGGGMCPPITNGVWIYGDADDTLFRLVSLGSVDLQKQGFSRQAIENIVAPMPSFGSIIAKPDDLWKAISWVKIQAYENTHKKQ
ncbi:MAG: cytochrome c class I [Methylovirgula sp.]